MLPLMRGAEEQMRSAAQRAVDADADERADDQRDGIDVGDLASRIEYRDEEKTGESADQGRRTDLQRDHIGASWAAVRVGQMPLASGTGGHQDRVIV